MIFLTVAFFALAVLSVLDFIETKYKNAIYIILSIFLFCIAAFRPPYVDRDYSNYVKNFKMNLIVGRSLAEPTFVLISDFINKFLFGNPAFLFIIYAFLGVATKLIAIKKLSNHIFLSLLVYFSYSFLLHEMTQIRAGVSLGFVMLAIKPLYNRKALPFFLLATLAFSFHYSAVVIYFLWFLNTNKINKTIYAILIPAAYIIYLGGSVAMADIISMLPQGEVLGKVARYEHQTGKGLNIFNVWQILRCLFCFIFLWKIELIKEHEPYAVLYLKMYILATVFFVLLAANPTISGRISDVFSIADILMLPCLVYIIKPRFVAVLIVILAAFSYLVLHLYFNKIILS
jgi:hypothetical protein